MTVVPDGIGIVVSDMARALAFYRLVGLPFPEGAETDDHVECTCNGYRLMLDLQSMVVGFAPEWIAPPAGQSRLALALRCESPHAVDARVAAVRAAGYTVHREPWDAFWGQRYAQVADPDGTVLDLFAPLP